MGFDPTFGMFNSAPSGYDAADTSFMSNFKTAPDNAPSSGGFSNTLGYLSMGLQAASGVAQYLQQRKADAAAQAAAEMQAQLTLKDAATAALNEKQQADAFAKMQRMLFLKSGVTLDGSPLLAMEETRTKGATNAKNIIDQAKAKAKIYRAQGAVSRASLVNTALDTGAGMLQSWTQMDALRRATQPAIS